VPIYEYKCSKCGEIFEAFQKINDEPLEHCKYCKGKVERLLSQTSFQLKGSGWYLTDYSRKSQPSGTAGDSASKSADKPEKSAGTGTGSSSTT
jgi:putative FmdB family regulatory protein